MKRRDNNDVYVLVHTMTLTERCLVIRARFVHTVTRNRARLLGHWVSWRMRPGLVDRRKAVSALKWAGKCDKNRIRHELHTFGIGSSNSVSALKSLPVVEDNTPVIQEEPPKKESSNKENIEKVVNNCNFPITSETPMQQTGKWLLSNRFGKYLETFANFCGADLLRMSRDDLIQICGKADGIRLYNALNAKGIAPKLTIYIRQENTNIYNAVYLSSFSCSELLQKLANIQGVSPEQVKNIIVQGPQSIHVQLSSDVLKHIKEETLFSFDVVEDSATYVFVLKPSSK